MITQVRQSRIYEVFLDGHLEIIYTFVCGMVNAAVLSSMVREEEEEEEGG